MAATVTKLESRRSGSGTAAGGPTVRATIDAFLDSPKIKSNPNTLRAYTGVLDRTAGQIGPDRALADIADSEIGDALAGLWGSAKPATWNRNRAAVGSWLAWCAGKQHWRSPALPGSAERRRENNDDTKAVSRSRIDRLCRRRDVPLREKTLWRMLYESASRASAVLALNIEDLDLPSKQARITAKGGDTMWITWGTGTAHLLPRLIAGRERGPLFLARHRPGPHRRATTDPHDICPETGRARLGYDRARILLARYGDGLRLHQLRHFRGPPTSATPTSPPTSSWPKPGTRACAAWPARSGPAWPPCTRPPRPCPAPDAGDKHPPRRWLSTSVTVTPALCSPPTEPQHQPAGAAGP